MLSLCRGFKGGSYLDRKVGAKFFSFIDDNVAIERFKVKTIYIRGREEI